jgi:hypothetical protein
MSDDKSHFILKKGDIEIEYEGEPEEVKSRFTEVFEWLKCVSTSTASPQIGQKREEKANVPQDNKSGDRGGARSRVVSPEIDKLVSEGFLDNFKTVDEVLAELKRRTVVAGYDSVNAGLTRRVPKTLDRIQNQEGKWVYRKKPKTTG